MKTMSNPVWHEKDLGPVSAWALAVKDGYTGTKEEWLASFANTKNNADRSEKFATGEIGGTAVPETDPAYHNNAEYYAGQAAGSASAAAGSATDANAAKEAAQAAQAEVEQYTADEIDDWLADHIDPETGYALDTTLSLSNAAAPADKVGDLKSAYNKHQHPYSIINRTMVGNDWDTTSSNVRIIKEYNTFELNGKKTSGDEYYFGVCKDARVAETSPTKSQCNDNFILQAGKQYKLRLRILSGNAVSSSNNLRILLYRYYSESNVMRGTVIANYSAAMLANGNKNKEFVVDLLESEDCAIGITIDAKINIQYNNLKFIWDIEEVNLNKITREDLENGAYSSSTGKSTGSTRIRLVNPFRAKKGTILRFNLASDFLFYVWELNSENTNGGNVIKSFGWAYEQTYEVGNDCFLMMAFRKSNDSNITIANFTDDNYVIIDKNPLNDAREWNRVHKITKNDLEMGGFSSSDGLESNFKRIRTQNLIYCSKGTRLKISIGELWWMCWILASDSRTGGANVIKASGWKQDQEYELTEDGYIQLAFATASTFDTSSNIVPADFTGCYVQITGPDWSDAYNEIDQIVKDYYDLTNTDKQAKIEAYAAELRNKTSIESFLFFTDSHWLNDTNWKDEFASALAEMGSVYKTAPVDFCIYGGDAVTGTSPQNQMTGEKAMYYLCLHDKMCRDTFGDDSYYPLVGNHDYNYQNTTDRAARLLNDTDLMHAWFRKWGKNYYSFKGNETTVYCLNTGLNRKNDGTGGYDVAMDEYKWGQIDWLANALIDDDPDHAMIAMHIIINNSVLTEFCLFTEANELCAAYNSHTTITKNGTTYDFTQCTGKVELFLAGHLHTDSYYGIKNGIPYVIRTTAKNTISPTYDLVLCDWTNQEALFKRFGSGDDLRIDLTTGEPVTDEEET